MIIHTYMNKIISEMQKKNIIQQFQMNDNIKWNAKK